MLLEIVLGCAYGGLLARLIAIPLDLVLAVCWVDPEDPLGMAPTWRGSARTIQVWCFILGGAMLRAWRVWRKTK